MNRYLHATIPVGLIVKYMFHLPFQGKALNSIKRIVKKEYLVFSKWNNVNGIDPSVLGLYPIMMLTGQKKKPSRSPSIEDRGMTLRFRTIIHDRSYSPENAAAVLARNRSSSSLYNAVISARSLFLRTMQKALMSALIFRSSPSSAFCG